MTRPPLVSIAGRLASGALELLYPRRCVACGAFGDDLCPACAARLEPSTATARCPNCDALWGGLANCPRCFGWTALDGARAAVEMDGVGRQVVHGLKYRRIEALAGLMAERLQPLRERVPFDVAIAIPLHRSRQHERGFNQADLILAASGWPCPGGALRRTRKTRTQVGLHARERRQNVGGAFRYDGGPLTGLRVVLVDDVLTTGSTADECAAVLKDAGARSVWALTFARASYDPGSQQPAAD